MVPIIEEDGAADRGVRGRFEDKEEDVADRLVGYELLSVREFKLFSRDRSVCLSTRDRGVGGNAESRAKAGGRNGVPMGEAVREEDGWMCCEKSVVQVPEEMRGPAHSSIKLTEEEEEAEEGATTRYNPSPFVDGKPNSRAILSNIDPMTG
jgi:hypothetical protein